MSGFNSLRGIFSPASEITRRVFLVEPRSEFRSLRSTRAPAPSNCSARLANMRVGNSIFTGGHRQSPPLWSNHANVTDIGVNWYLNHYTKLTLDWQYSDFGRPVELGANKFSSFCNMYWLRAQVFF